MLRFTPSDKKSILTLAALIEANRHSMPELSLPDGGKACLEYLLRFEAGHKKKSTLISTATLSGEVVGFFIAKRSEYYAINYGIDICIEAAAIWPQHRAKGLAKSFVLQCKALSHEFFDVERIGARVADSNTKMIRLLKAYGFRVEGHSHLWNRGAGIKAEIMHDYVEC